MHRRLPDQSNYLPKKLGEPSTPAHQRCKGNSTLGPISRLPQRFLESLDIDLVVEVVYIPQALASLECNPAQLCCRSNSWHLNYIEINILPVRNRFQDLLGARQSLVCCLTWTWASCQHGSKWHLTISRMHLLLHVHFESAVFRFAMWLHTVWKLII